jgi:hypothetical protein
VESLEVVMSEVLIDVYEVEDKRGDSIVEGSYHADDSEENPNDK